MSPVKQIETQKFIPTPLKLKDTCSIRHRHSSSGHIKTDHPGCSRNGRFT